MRVAKVAYLSAVRRLLVLLLLPLSALANASLVPSPPTINADSYLVIDFDTGAVLVEHNADLQLPPASLTKLMTAYILAEEVELGRLSLSDSVRVSRNAWSQNPVFNGSSLMWIEPGKPVTVAELERGIVISSGNDATVAIAEHIAGSEVAFVDLMNQYAQKMGRIIWPRRGILPARPWRPFEITPSATLSIKSRAIPTTTSRNITAIICCARMILLMA